MEWKNFEESKTDLPDVLIEKMIEGFSNATSGLAQLSIIPVSELQKLSSTNKLNNRFQFKVLLTSANVPDYSFKVFEFGYNVSLYPVSAIITSSILEELNRQGTIINKISVFENEDNFKKSIELVFGSKRFTEIISGLMKIAKKDIPF